MSSTGRWSSSTQLGSVLRLALVGSKRDRGILASTYGQPPEGQEIISVDDHGGIEITLKEADRYIIHGLSLVGDNTTANFKPFQNPFVLHDAPFSPLGTKRFSLTMTRAGPGINVWTAPQGATVAGGCPTVTVTETVTDEDGNETEVETEEVRCRSYIFDYDIVTRIGFDDEEISEGRLFRWYGTTSGSEDTPTAPGVTLGDTAHGNIALDTPLMAVLGEPLHAMVQNLGQSDDGYVSLGGANSTILSQRFTTGTGSDRYRLQGIGINIEGSDDSNGNAQVPSGPSSVSVAVHARTGSQLGIKLFDLVSPGEFRPGHNFFEAPPGAYLEPNTTYVVVWSYLGGTWHRLQKTLSDNLDSGALSGFKLGGSLEGGGRFEVGDYLDSLDPELVGNSPTGAALEFALYGEAVDDPPFVAGGYQVGKNWFHIPDDVEVGDQFRLVFVAGYTDAMSADIEDYNSLVQREAAWEGNHRIIRGAAPDFKAVVCTAEVDARTNTEITGAEGVPVYWLDGGWDDRPRLIANSYSGFYSGEWINTQWGAYSTGNSTYFHKSNPIWTGCDAAGFAHPEAHMGTTSPMRMAAVGNPAALNVSPLGSHYTDEDYVSAEIDKRYRLYAMSPVFTVARLHRRRL